MQWLHEGKHYREATAKEIADLQALPGAPHVLFGCICGKAAWSAKNLALTPVGGYAPVRTIFFLSEDAECKCASTDLICIVPQAEA